VPEIYHGLVEIRSIAREPGHRSKVAVAALQAGIDPVGACVGMRGVRIQAIVRELNDEKIDVIEWNPDPAMYIAKALSPARVTGVYLDKMARGTKTATVVVPEDQLSLAIGRDGQNARLAAKLTGWRIDIKSLPEATSDALYKLQNDPTYAEEAVIEVEAGLTPQIEVILVKKSEGRPVTPEEYKLLSQFVERVEQGNILRHQADRIAEKERQEAAREVIPAPAFDLTLEDIELSQRWVSLLSEAGFSIVGNLMYQMNLDPDVILALNGVGPKAMKEIQAKLAELDFPAEVEEIEDEVEVVEADAETLETAAEVVDGETVEVAAPEAGEETVGEAPVEAELEAVEEVVEVKVASAEVEKPKVPKKAVKPKPTIVFVEDAELEVLEKKDKKKKKQVFREVEYDPDKDVTIVKRRRKREEGDWEDDEWDF
jgi:N utilization substance protein A